MKINQEQLDYFHEHGYIIIENFFTKDELENFNVSLQKIINSVLEEYNSIDGSEIQRLLEERNMDVLEMDAAS